MVQISQFSVHFPMIWLIVTVTRQKKNCRFQHGFIYNLITLQLVKTRSIVTNCNCSPDTRVIINEDETNDNNNSNENTNINFPKETYL